MCLPDDLIETDAATNLSLSSNGSVSVEEGDTISVTCESSGGFPHPRVELFLEDVHGFSTQVCHSK